MKRLPKFKLAIFVLLVLAGACICIYFPKSLRQTVEGALGMKLPNSARNIVVLCNWHPNSTIIDMWSVMEMPLSDAQVLAYTLGLREAPPGNSIQIEQPTKPLSGWSDLARDDIAGVPTKWMKLGPRLLPAFLVMVWANGKLYLYQSGFYGQTSDKP